MYVDVQMCVCVSIHMYVYICVYDCMYMDVCSDKLGHLR